METKCHEWSWPVLTQDNLMHSISKPQNNGQFFNHISHCYDMIWDTNPTPTSSQATKHNARRCEFPELCANLEGHSVITTSRWHPGEVIRWYLSSHTRSWSIGQWPVPTQATGSEQWEWWECSYTQGISWGPCVSVPPEGSIGGCGIEMWRWKATTQNFNPALQLWCQRKSSLHGETYTSKMVFKCTTLYLMCALNEFYILYILKRVTDQRPNVIRLCGMWHTQSCKSQIRKTRFKHEYKGG